MHHGGSLASQDTLFSRSAHTMLLLVGAIGSLHRPFSSLVFPVHLSCLACRFHYALNTAYCANFESLHSIGCISLAFVFFWWLSSPSFTVRFSKAQNLGNELMYVVHLYANKARCWSLEITAANRVRHVFWWMFGYTSVFYKKATITDFHAPRRYICFHLRFSSISQEPTTVA